MSDLVEFLRARLDEDERVACQHHLTNWHFDGIKNHIVNDDGVTVAIVRTTQEHIQRHDPARVLREVEAQRRIIDEHGIVHRNIGWMEDGDDEYGEIPVCGLCVPKRSHYRCREEVPEGPCLTVRLLALPFADHEDYREDWRP